MYTDIIFDLDGTINRSGEGIQETFRISMAEAGKELPPDRNLDFVIGPPLSDSYRKVGIPEEEVETMVASFRAHYKTTGIFINSVYPGMEDLLRELKEEGRHLYVATCKAEEVANLVLEYFHLRNYFDFVGAASDPLHRKHKTEVLQYTIENIPSPKECMVMIGDRRDDMEAAESNGIDSIGVEYGYGSYEELVSAGAKHIAKTVEDIKKFL